MRVLIGCEYSGVVRDAFIAKGHEAMSCDLLPSDAPGPHYQGDVRDVLDYPWDMAIFFPPCTDLSVSGARWFPAKKLDGSQYASISFFMHLAKSDIHRIAIENPVGIMSSYWRKPCQTVQPWQFGSDQDGPDNIKKRTCLWLRGLPKLKPTGTLDGSTARDEIHRASPGPDRWKLRSRFFPGLARAMAEQWGGYALRVAA